uniref:Uncharacterized protein n=1 Tax=Arundo donax TaxID=35708 RepID=A0A0A9D9K9_ARUDO
MWINDRGSRCTLYLEFRLRTIEILEVNPGREGHDDAVAATGRAEAPLVVGDPEAALAGALPPQPLLGGEVALLEPATVGGREEHLLPPLDGVEDEYPAVQRAVGAEQEGDAAVVGAEAEPRGRRVARRRVPDDLIHRQGKSASAGAGRLPVAGAGGHHGLEARLLAADHLRAALAGRLHQQ